MSRVICSRRPVVGAGIVIAGCFVLSSLSARGDEPKSSTSAKAPAAPTRPAQAELPVGRSFPEDIELEQRIRDALREPTELQYLDTQLGDVVMDLSLRCKVPVALDVAALEDEGKGKDTTLTLSVRGISLRSGLRLLLNNDDLTYAVTNESLLITTRSAAEAMPVTRAYQVHDLVLHPSDTAAEHPDFDSLNMLIVSSVKPESWREAGGVAGECHSYTGPGLLTLVITQTEEAHENIERLLATLRAAKEPKVLELQRRAPPPVPEPSGGFGGNDEKPAKETEAAKPAAEDSAGKGGGFF